MTVRAATGHPRSGLPGREVGDGHHLGRLGCKTDQVLDRGLARDIKDSVDRPTGSGPDPRDHALAGEHRGRPDLPQVVMVRLTRGGEHPRAPGDRHLHRRRAHAARATVDKDRVAGVDVEQPKTAFTVSPATPAAAATAQSMDDGLAAQESRTVYSA